MIHRRLCKSLSRVAAPWCLSQRWLCTPLASALYGGIGQSPDPEGVTVYTSPRTQVRQITIPPIISWKWSSLHKSNRIGSKMESLMLSRISANQNLTTSLCPALPEKGGLGQPVHIRYLTWIPRLPLALKQESSPALTYQKMPSITPLFLLTLVYKNLLPCIAPQSSLLSARFMNH